MEPELFAPGIVSTAGGEWSSTFATDGKTFLFGYRGGPNGILVMEEIDGRWTEPRLVPFSGEYSDFDLNLSPDGIMLYFTSRRPGVAPAGAEENSDLWVVVRGENGWGQAVNLGEPVNTAASELYPSVTEDGTLYFFGDARGGAELGGAYVARLTEGSYSEPELLGPTINTEHGVFDPFIAPDESFIIFASDRPEGSGDGDLYISFRQDDGTWGEAMNLGSTINSPQTDFCPSVTKDGKYLFFSSRRPYEGTYPNISLSYRDELDVEAENPGRNVDVYWVDAQVLEQFRQ
jgi:Tol biopolymer transport system component